MNKSIAGWLINFFLGILPKKQTRLFYFFAAVLLVSLNLSSIPCNRGYAASEQSTRLKKPQKKQSTNFDVEDPSLQRMAQMQKRFISASTNLISVNDAIKIALANNPSLKIAKSAIDSQYYDLLAARRQWMPTLVFDNTLPTLGSFNSKSFVKFKKEPLGGVPQDYQVNSKYYTFAPEILATWTFLSVPRTASIKSNF
jgi:hypothetical protein